MNITSTDIRHPHASNFVEWLFSVFKTCRIKYIDIDTDGDYHLFIINGNKFSLDWKHLDDEDINNINDTLKQIDYTIQYIKTNFGYKVTFDKI